SDIRHGRARGPYLKLALCPHSLAVTSQLYLDHSHCLVLAPATLAALPSTRAIPDRDVFYVAPPGRSILPSSPSSPPTDGFAVANFLILPQRVFLVVPIACRVPALTR